MKKRKYKVNLLDLGRNTAEVFTENEGNVFSGYTTLYILMALIPLIILLVGVINLLPGEYLQQFADVFVGLFPNIPQIRELVNDILDNINPHAGTVAISLSALTSLWSASNGIWALQLGLRKISGTGSATIRDRLVAMVYTLLFVILIPMLLIFRVMRSSLENLLIALATLLEMPDFASPLIDILENSGLITFAAMGFVILLTYTYLQGHKRKLWTQLPGSFFTIGLWVLFSRVFEIFITKFWQASSIYGSLVSIFLTALWMKTIITILFLGAALNEALFRMRKRRQSIEEETDEIMRMPEGQEQNEPAASDR